MPSPPQPRPSIRARFGIAGLLAAVMVGHGCNAHLLPIDGAWSARELAMVYSLSPLPTVPVSEGNRFADDERAAELGLSLFFEEGLSGNDAVSCATCHQPGMYFADGKALSTGTNELLRHTPTVIGSQWATFLNWDGRADSIWSQALGPIEDENEMDSTRLAVAHFIYDEYRAPFESIFGDLPDLSDFERFPAQGRPVPGSPSHEHAVAWETMDPEDRQTVNQIFASVGKALEAYERKLVPKPAPFDAYVDALQAGDVRGGGHLNPAALRGLESFVGPAGCINCHNGPLFTDFGFHNVGLEPIGVAPDASYADVIADLDRGRAVGAWKSLGSPFRTDGRYGDAEINLELEFLAPDFEDFEGAFRTPSLRNVAVTAPYGHGGQFADLAEVIEWYRDLPRVKMVGHRDLVLGLFDQAVDTPDLIEFLKTLTGPLPDIHWLTPPRD